jgi:hypothetical protein
MYDFLALVRLDVLDPALRTLIVAAATPNIRPLFAIFGAPIIIHELSFRHFALSLRNTLMPVFPARQSP